MAKSLVERLNSWSHDPMAAAASDLMEEAANEIERLEREYLANEKLVATLAEQVEDLEGQLEHSKQVAWNRLSAAEKDAAIGRG